MLLWLQVRKRPLNKKELAKNEEDIIETLSNSITVHETKLKVNFGYTLAILLFFFLFLSLQYSISSVCIVWFYTATVCEFRFFYMFWL